MQDNETYLVASASGQLGRQVLDALLKGGAKRVIATTRNPDSLQAYAQRGVEIRQADYTQPQGLAEAFRGATRLLIISTQGEGTRQAQHNAALQAAKAAGVRHLFYTSHACPEESVSIVAPDHAAMEKEILASDMTYTILRNFLYSENWLLILPAALESGTLYGASGEGRIAYISRRDCGAAAAGAMLQALRHENRIYDITGAHAHTYAEIVDMVSDVLGRRITYVDMTPEAFRERLLSQGVPPALAHAFESFERSNALDEGNRVTPLVRQLTGHDPEPLRDFLRDNLHKVDPSLTLATLMHNYLTF